MFNPDPKVVSNKEIVGRRTFGNPFVENGGKISTGHLKVDVFFDKDLTADISVDRLGLKKPNEHALIELTSLARSHGQRLSKVFSGWAALPVEWLQKEKCDIQPTDAFGEINKWHAEISRAKWREEHHAQALAHTLCRYAMGYMSSIDCSLLLPVNTPRP